MNNSQLFLVFCLGTLVITGCALVVIFSVIIQKRRQVSSEIEQQKLSFEYQQALLHSRLEVQEATLSSLARELHDGVNTILTGGLMQVRLATELMENDEGKIILSEAQDSINEAIGSVRSLSHNMHAGMIEDIGLAGSIKRELERMSGIAGIRYTLDIAGKREPTEDHQILIYRVVQEAFQNILKHASAATVRVQIDGTPEHYHLIIRDDGKGFDIHQKKESSLGLRRMNERISLANGRMTIDSQRGAGTSISLQIPMNA